MHGSSEAVCSVVADGNGILLVLELGNGTDGTEDLFLHNTHVFGDVGEDGRFDEEALGTDALATSFDLGAGRLTLLDVAVMMLACVFTAGRVSILPHDAVEL